MSKNTEYTKAFEQFWSAYPRKVAKAPAFKAWQKQVDESDAFLVPAIIADVEKRTRLKFWAFDKTKIPHAATWINARRWEDEGWEDDIKTRGREDAPPSTPMNYTARIEDDYGLDSWQTMMNRIMRSYILACGGVPDSSLQSLIKIKNEVYTECRQAIREDLDLAEDKNKARGEAAYMLAGLMLGRFDSITGRALKPAILVAARR